MKVKFFPFGPLLFNCTVSEEDCKSIEKLFVKDDKLSHHKKLAGHIKHEYKIEKEKLNIILRKYLNAFEGAHENYYLNKKNFFINDSWVNFMKEGDFNPIHTHNLCDFSAVLFIKVPNEIKEEHANFEGQGFGAGVLTFITGTQTVNFISQRSFFPEERELFIFPKDLLHYVAPFKSDVERVSVAFNLEGHGG